jgi:hypothetical protein
MGTLEDRAMESLEKISQKVVAERRYREKNLSQQESE